MNKLVFIFTSTIKLSITSNWGNCKEWVLYNTNLYTLHLSNILNTSTITDLIFNSRKYWLLNVLRNSTLTIC